MSITIGCDECGRLFEVNDEFVGTSVKCPYCGKTRVATVPEFTNVNIYRHLDQKRIRHRRIVPVIVGVLLLAVGALCAYWFFVQKPRLEIQEWYTTTKLSNLLSIDPKQGLIILVVKCRVTGKYPDAFPSPDGSGILLIGHYDFSAVTVDGEEVQALYTDHLGRSFAKRETLWNLEFPDIIFLLKKDDVKKGLRIKILNGPSAALDDSNCHR
jgi:hypothetical protein